MVCGSFLLAALLNRSAMEEIPAAAPVAPATVVTPAASEVEVAPDEAECTEAEARMDTDATVAPTERPAPNSCDDARVAAP